MVLVPGCFDIITFVNEGSTLLAQSSNLIWADGPAWADSVFWAVVDLILESLSTSAVTFSGLFPEQERLAVRPAEAG